MKNNIVTIDGAKTVQKIYGPSVSTLMGKETRTTPEHVRTEIIMPVPQAILDIYQQVTLCADILFFGTLVVFTTFSRKYYLQQINV